MKTRVNFKLIIITVPLLVLLLSASGGVIFLYFTRDLPELKRIADYRPWLSSKVYSANGVLLAEFFEQRRDLTPSTQFPKYLKPAFIATEDADFFKHRGLNYRGITRAFLRNLKEGRIVEGGSSITQQVAKTLLLTPERKYRRKFMEAVLAKRIEKSFSKDDILYIYLNQIPLGHGFYGVGAAARGYFSKDVKDLNLQECAMLAGLTKAPANYSPIRHPEEAKNRRDFVLFRMQEEGYISEEEYEQAVASPLGTNPMDISVKAPYFCEYIRQDLKDEFGWETLYHGGLKVYTTLDYRMQRAAEAAVKRGLEELDHRQGYRGPKESIPKKKWAEFIKNSAEEYKDTKLIPGEVYRALVTGVDDSTDLTEIKVAGREGIIRLKDMNWARKVNLESEPYNIKSPSTALKPGYVIEVKYLNSEKEGSGQSVTHFFSLYQEPEVQGALVCIENETGKILAMVGGRDFSQSQFNRAVQARRQVGSAFKPFVYAAALDKGYTPATLILDTAEVYDEINPGGIEEKTWRPENYDREFLGPQPMREGLVKSINLVTIKIMRDIGVDYSINFIRRFNITDPMDRNLSLALGSCSVQLLEMVDAYSVFPMAGRQASPYSVNRILDRYGNLKLENEPKVREVINPETAYIITNILQDVVRRGTGWRVRELKRTVAGKTGTTNDQKDAWFMGFTPKYTAGVWVGFDDNRLSLGKSETGSRAASPIWLYFMAEALKNIPDDFFEVPQGVVFAKIDRENGLLADPKDPNAFEEVFKAGTEPTQYSGEVSEYNPDEFFLIDLDSQK